MKSLAGKIAVVTGASRGIGKGIALQLAEAGATVYITGRTLSPQKDDSVGGSLQETAAEVEKCGGKCIPVQCDHGKDEDVKKLFERVKQEQDGQLDVLVNNAYSGVNAIVENMEVPFWEQDLSMWDTINNVGLRNHYQCSVFASQLMVPRKQGLIINISSAGGMTYFVNVPYGVGKEACDRMAADCAVELKKHSVAFVSLWPGLVKTEKVLHLSETSSDKEVSLLRKALPIAETTEYAGKCVVSLASDPNVMKKTGRILMSRDLGDEYGFVDINGRNPPNMRSVSYIVGMTAPRVAAFIPDFFKVPYWVLSLFASKF